MYKFSSFLFVIVTQQGISCLAKEIQKTQTLVQETPNFIGTGLHTIKQNIEKIALSINSIYLLVF